MIDLEIRRAKKNEYLESLYRVRDNDINKLAEFVEKLKTCEASEVQFIAMEQSIVRDRLNHTMMVIDQVENYPIE